MKKIFVLDTSVILHDSDSLLNFENNIIVLPLTVISELDAHKRDLGEVGRNARSAIKLLDSLREKGSLKDGVVLENGGLIKIEINHNIIHTDLNPDIPDDRILSIAYNLMNDPENKYSVALVSKDLNLRVKADVIGVIAQDYFHDKINLDYNGIIEKEFLCSDINELYQQGSIECEDNDIIENQFVILKGIGNCSSSALGRFSNGKIHKLLCDYKTDFLGIKALNKEQLLALELLCNDNIKIVSIIGSSGSGKTILSMAVALYKILEECKYKKLLGVKPIIPIGIRDLGFLPGSMDEKLFQWVRSYIDNLEVIFKKSKNPFESISHLKDSNLIEFNPISYMRGRSLNSQFVVIDEIQNLTQKELKTILSRIGSFSKVVCLSDPDQIDNNFLDKYSCASLFLVNKLKGSSLFGHVTLTKTHRSDISELISTKL